MSRSNNTELTTPAKYFFEWNGKSGGFRYFDKSKGEKVPVKLPFRFMVLDTFSTIKGFNKAENSGYYSNEVRDIKTETITVRNKKGICATGLYHDVIGDRNCRGSKYIQSVYIAYKEGDTMVIANIAMGGAALGPWIDFRKLHKNKIFEGAVQVKKFVEGKTGDTIFQSPVFEFIEATPESNEAAKALDVELQKYFTDYFKVKKSEEAHESVAEVVAETKQETIVTTEKPEQSTFVSDPNDDLPF